MIAVLPGSEEDELRLRDREQIGAEDQIESLLRHHPRAHSEERHLPSRSLGQAVRLLQRCLTAPLPGQIVSRVRVGELQIGRRVPKIGIDAVQDPRQAVAEADEGDRLAGILNGIDPRSEEHTSELQSRLHLVCRLLLEKKKQTNNLPKSMR